MLGLFKRATPVADACELGSSAVALPVRSGCNVPPQFPVVVVDARGSTRRAGAAAAKRIELRDGELAYAFHPGPYTVDLLPFAGAPEIGLRTRFAIAADAQATHQRFDLYLASEVSGRLGLDALVAAMEGALQRELQDGGLALPPCTTIDEWNAFRLGLNQLLYMRFGVTVDDCVPADLGGSRDYAALLAARAAGGAATLAPKAAPAVPAAAADAIAEPAIADARALRRLFLELPCLMCGLRLAALPASPEQFRQQQAMLQRLDLLCVGVNAMPALAMAAPGQALGAAEQQRRARHSRRATVSLDEAWALLARLKNATPALLAPLYDEAERIVANLEADCEGRRRTQGSANESETA
ncbi:hypothetical protein [Herbaspirillum sp. SJZ107]|uniref:hypothetical protein n=1 Tax=Herbaspirillum sp. SJZ107 TaxID=2572881 RepID=UPI001153C5F2|nr:hypothetical protein [Herbaspirillum sp. SJZ107]TQK11142.1 hypothetical protein FBX97_1079 [Herbaspirillum sp. SJZ107]